jgi:predicted metallopeptidase
MRNIDDVLEDLRELDEVTLVEVLQLDPPMLIELCMERIEELNEEGRL